MPEAKDQGSLPGYLPGCRCQVFRAEDFHVASGVNLGDSLTEPDLMCLGDAFTLAPNAQPLRLGLSRADTTANGRVQTIGGGSAIGAPGEPVELTARLTLMAPDGDRVELLLLVHRVEGGGIYVLPLSPIAPHIEYTLLKADTAPADTRLTDLVCVSFARGTMITLASGEQRRIESLAQGDRILTRDHGPQPLRLLVQATLRAVGAFAPVVITRGTLGNESDLIVSQHHRMFLYQRAPAPGVETSELLVQAKHLVDGDRVYLRDGGFVDYFSLIFDQHEIVYAEGIPAESLMVSEATLCGLPAGLADEVKARFPGLHQIQHFGTEAGRETLDGIGRAALYKPQRDGRDAR
jgi:hypothetical protein